MMDSINKISKEILAKLPLFRLKGNKQSPRLDRLEQEKRVQEFLIS
jgi:hypothetical protein